MAWAISSAWRYHLDQTMLINRLCPQLVGSISYAQCRKPVTNCFFCRILNGICKQASDSSAINDSVPLTRSITAANSQFRMGSRTEIAIKFVCSFFETTLRSQYSHNHQAEWCRRLKMNKLKQELQFKRESFIVMWISCLKSSLYDTHRERSTHLDVG